MSTRRPGPAPIPALDEGARNCARFGNVRAGEEVAIIAEPGVDEAVVDALAIAMKDAGARVSILVKEPTGQAQPLSAVHAAVLRAADAVFELGVPSAHTEAGFLAGFDYGTRQLALRPSREVLASEAARFPVEIFYELGRRAQRLLRSERRIHVSDDRGTDLAMELEPGSVGGYIGPVPYEPGPAVPGYLGSFPPGSCVWGDVNYSITGRVAFDAVYEFPAPREAVVCEIDKGWMTSIDGGAEAEAIAALVFSTKNAHRVAECGFGLNPKVPLTAPGVGEDPRATIVFWTRRAGTFFLGMGGDTLQGGKDASAMSPIYGFLRAPTVTVGDTVLMSGGRMAWLDQPDAALVALAESVGGEQWLATGADG